MDNERKFSLSALRSGDALRLGDGSWRIGLAGLADFWRGKTGLDVWKDEPLLYDELVRRREAMLPELEERKIDSWETLEQREPELAEKWFDGVRKIEGGCRKKRGLPYDDATLGNVALNLYNEVLFHVYDLHAQAMRGQLDSIFQLGRHYQMGDDVPEDLYFAFRLLRFAAEQNFQQAYSVLGKCYMYGHGTAADPEEALRWFRRIDYSEDVEILAFIAWCHQSGTGFPKDEAKAWDYYTEAAEKGHSEGFRFCRAAANAGHAMGQYILGHFYQHGYDMPSDIQAALHWFHQAAEQNHVLAQCRLGVLYGEGNYGIERDPEIAMKWFQLAAAQGNSDAKLHLALHFAFGDGVEKNIDEAARIWKELAQECPDHPKGDPSSQCQLGQFYFIKEHPEYNPRKGVKLLRKAAAQGFMYAQLCLGILYSDGSEPTVRQNWKEARSWFHKAAKQGSSQAQYCLGEIFFDGNGVAVNRKEAFALFKKSASGGYIPAIQKLAHCCLHGIGTRKDEEEGYWHLATLALSDDAEALTLLQSAAVSGNAAAEFGMWIYYRENNDLETATCWIEKAAEKGNANALCTLALRHQSMGNDAEKLRYFRLAAEKGDVTAQTQLSLTLENTFDWKAPENEESFHWMKAAADQGDSTAYYFLGNYYFDGTGVDVDDQKAFECYFKAAEMGESDGIERLGLCHLYGIGVQRDHDVAFQYFQRAAAMGNPKGQCSLGICYLHGYGCRQNAEFALQWISLAANSGHFRVMNDLKQQGLDMEKLNDGYKHHRRQRAEMTGDRFGENFDQIFNSPNNKSILPIPPGEKHGE
jgi:TPR repeat protein